MDWFPSTPPLTGYATFDSEFYMVNPFDVYIHNRVYLTDKDLHIYGYALSLSVVEYQTPILRGDTEAAAETLPTLPKDRLNKVARFFEARDLRELALQITTDPDHKFDLALDDLDTALQITQTILENESEIKWKALGDRVLIVWRFDWARECFEKAGDLCAFDVTFGGGGGIEMS